ncbi:hypothetical protein HOY80DRAFT_1061259 [Tuber brumale]|nr:hypothetical protein HOY80DRAFT_1061259 [Tuber brumale]
MHEELFHPAEQTSGIGDRSDRIVRGWLFASDLRTLVRLQNKWEFSQYLRKPGCGGPRVWLCRDMDGVQALPHGEMELELKPAYGRAVKNVYHLKPDTLFPDEFDVGPESDVYPVVDTIDDSSCLYFQSIEHAGIRAYAQRIADMILDRNPRATSGIHLWSGTPDLAYSFTRSSPAVAKPGARRQAIPGMLMWSKKSAGLGELEAHGEAYGD